MSPKDKAILDRIYDKHYGPDAKRMKGNKAKKENAKIAKVIKEKKATATEIKPQEPRVAPIETGVKIVDHPTSTRKDLMAEAQKRGIKYFRILTKNELTDVLKPTTTPKQISAIQATAKARWQAGWKKNRKLEPVTT